MQNRTKCLLGVVVCGALTWSGWTAFSADPPPPANGGIRAFMRMKLDASTKILEGLTTENFQMIGEGAKTLQSMSSAEKWRVSNDVLYRQYRRNFVFTPINCSRRQMPAILTARRWPGSSAPCRASAATITRGPSESPAIEPFGHRRFMAASITAVASVSCHAGGAGRSLV